MKNKTNAEISTQRRGGAETQKDVVPPRETPAATGKELSEKQIIQKRHALFENFADFAMGQLSDDPALACKAAETALKALSTGEHDHPGASHSPGDGLKTLALSKFSEDLERAYEGL